MNRESSQMRWSDAGRKRLKYGVLFLPFLAFAGLGSSHSYQIPNDNCVECHSRSTGRAAEVVGLHRQSTHGKASISCQACHGGNADASEKQKAHSGQFVGKPDANGTLAMCGNCHQQPLDQFKSSRHFQAPKGQPRLDCAECHGAHSIGNPPETFSFSQYCAGCHGLEYLPALPGPFEQVLAMTDEVRDRLAALRFKGKPIDKEVESKRADMRRRIADIVHPTDLKGGLERIPALLRQGEEINSIINTSKKGSE